MKKISPKDVERKLDNKENLHLVDVREEEEVENGMIPGAKHIPLGEIPNRLDELDPSTEYIVVCRSGGRSGRAQQFLYDKGFDVVNMEGGMLAWEGKTTPK